jgi:hypothetical protein
MNKLKYLYYKLYRNYTGLPHRKHCLEARETFLKQWKECEALINGRVPGILFSYGHGKSLMEIAKTENVTSERIRQIIRKYTR